MRVGGRRSPCDVRGQVGGLAVAELGQRIVGRPHVVGPLRGLAMPRDEQDARAHAVPQKRMRGQRDRVRAAHEVVDGHVLVDRVRPRRSSAGRTPTEGVPAESVYVAPSYQESRPLRRDGSPTSALAASTVCDDRVVRRDLHGRDVGCPREARRVLGEPGVGGAGAPDPLGHLVAHARAVAVGVRERGREQHGARDRARGRVGDRPLARRA